MRTSSSLLLLAALLLAAAPAAAQCTLSVTTSADSGAGSLRQTLLDANADPDLSTVCFAIAGDGPHAIAPQSALPTITAPVVIDGYTQAGASENTLDVGNDAVLMIELDGSAAGVTSGLAISAGGSTVRGLAINRFSGDGITLSAGSGHLVEGNFIGTNVSGTSPAPNEDDGVTVEAGTSDSEIRGNVLSGNADDGIDFYDPGTSGNVVEGNLIGTNALGTAAIPNQDDGVTLNAGASGNVVRDNVLSGNADDGIDFHDPGTSGNVVRDNLIGTNAAGTAAIPNEDDGVDLDSGAGDNLFVDNVISGNGDNGVDIMDAETTGTILHGNLIGTDAAGTGPLGNGDEGMDIEVGVSHTRIGGTQPGEGNVIAHNQGNGVAIEGSTSVSNVVLGNAIYGNGGRGIDLESDGSTPNDPGDADVGPNNHQNFPGLRRAPIDDAGDLRVAYVVDAEPGHSLYPLRIEFFRADADAEEGQVYLGFDDYSEADWDGCGSPPCVKTAALGNAADLGVADGDPLVATATDADDNTSEFSIQAFGVAREPGPGEAHPQAFALHAAYPNPFTTHTTLSYDVPEAGRVRLAVCDALGREVARLVDAERPAGRHEAVLDAAGLASGTYLVRLTAPGGSTQTRRVTLTR